MNLPVVDDQGSILEIRMARSQEREVLQEIQRRASLANPGDREAILAHPEAIDLPLQQLLDGNVVVASLNRALIGFAVLLFTSQDEAELDGLFVEPDYWRKGVGQRLLQASRKLATDAGVRSMKVIANHHASAFYKSVGFHSVGEVSTQFGVATRMELRL